MSCTAILCHYDAVIADQRQEVRTARPYLVTCSSMQHYQWQEEIRDGGRQTSAPGALALYVSARLAESVNQCVKYSWLGPDSSKLFEESELYINPNNALRLSNRTCKDFPKPKPIPCISPFVVGEDGKDGTSPNSADVFDGFHQNVTCPPGNGDVCAIAAWYFDNEVVNMTAYCTRVTIDGSNSMKNGCVTAKKGAYTNTVCVCDPSTKDFCNLNLNITNGKTTGSQSPRLLFSCLILLSLLMANK